MMQLDQILKDNQTALHTMIILRHAMTTINKLENQLFKAHDLTPMQFGVLEVLYSKGNLRIQDLIDKLFATSGNMTVVIKNMVRDGWIYKTSDPSDKRAFLVGLTPKGREKIETVLPLHAQNVHQIFSVLTTEQQNQLADLLRHFKYLETPN